MLLAIHGATIAASVPMILRRVAPNPLYGFRTPKTLSSERIWYEANAVAGRWIAAAMIVSAIIALPLFEAFPAQTAFIASLGVLTGAVLVATAASLLALSRM